MKRRFLFSAESAAYNGAMTETIGARIKIARNRRMPRFTQDEVAGWFGITRNAVSEWERKNNGPEKNKLPELAKRLNCDLLWLLSGDNKIDLDKHPGLNAEPEKARNQRELVSDMDLSKKYVIALEWVRQMPEDLQIRFINDVVEPTPAETPTPKKSRQSS